jgi:nucleoside-diphosphate-sugar epimerase
LSNAVTLVTGANGFLGSRVLCKLLESGRTVLATRRKDSDIRRIRDLESHQRLSFFHIDSNDPAVAFSGREIVSVVHCATDYGRGVSDPWQVAEANIILPLRLLTLAVRCGCRAFVNTDTVLDKRISPYSLSKSQFVQWLEFYAKDVASCSVALEHFYGPFDDPTKFTAMVISALARRESALQFTPGEQQRYFLHVDDAAHAVIRALEHTESRSAGHRRYEVGADEPISIRQFVLTAWEAAYRPRTQLQFGRLPYRENEVMSPSIDTSAIKSLGWSARTPLLDGLRAAIHAERSATCES